MYENLSVSDEANPISSYKLYMTKRPKETLVDGSPFYSTVNDHSKEKSALSSAKWFKLQPMGANNLNTFRQDFAKAAGLGIDKRITSHGAKKILVQRLRDSDVFPIEIVQMISHKNLQFINNHSSLGESQQMSISTLLSTACSSTSVSQRLQSQTVLQPVIRQNFSATLVPGKSQIFKSFFQGNYISGETFIFLESKNFFKKQIPLPRQIVSNFHTEHFTVEQSKRIGEETEKKGNNTFWVNLHLLILQLIKQMKLLKLKKNLTRIEKSHWIRWKCLKRYYKDKRLVLLI